MYFAHNHSELPSSDPFLWSSISDPIVISTTKPQPILDSIRPHKSPPMVTSIGGWISTNGSLASSSVWQEVGGFHSILVRNIKRSPASKNLLDFFAKKYGEVSHVSFDFSNSFGIITYYDHRYALAALKGLAQDLDARETLFCPIQGPLLAPFPNINSTLQTAIIEIHGLDSSWTEMELHKELVQYGPIRELVRSPMSVRSSSSQPIFLVEFFDQRSANAALLSLDGVVLDSQKIRVFFYPAGTSPWPGQQQPEMEARLLRSLDDILNDDQAQEDVSPYSDPFESWRAASADQDVLVGFNRTHGTPPHANNNPQIHTNNHPFDPNNSGGSSMTYLQAAIRGNNAAAASTSNSSGNVMSNSPGSAVNVEAIMNGSDTRTSIMIRNIPNKYSVEMMLEFINQSHANTYGLFYLPMDFKNLCNMGYAFVDFKSPVFVASFFERIHGKKWPTFNSLKIADIRYADIQGRAQLIRHFQKSKVHWNHSAFWPHRPRLFYASGPNNGEEEPFFILDPATSDTTDNEGLEDKLARMMQTSSPPALSTKT